MSNDRKTRHRAATTFGTVFGGALGLSRFICIIPDEFNKLFQHLAGLIGLSAMESAEDRWRAEIFLHMDNLLDFFPPATNM